VLLLPVPLAAEAHTVDGAGAFLGTLQMAASGNDSRMMFWAYRTLGPHLPAPTLAAVWLLCGVNAMFRRDGILRTFGDDFANASPIELALEMFRRILDHPEGVEVAKAADGYVTGYADGRIRLVPEAIVPEIGRALAAPAAADPDYPFVMAAGLRTRWTANTIQRDPAWRKGRGPHCSLNLSPADAEKLGVASGDALRVSTPRGELTLPAQVDAKLLDGHVWMPNGFGHVWGEAPVGGNQNELTDVGDRDPFTGIPHHRYVPVQLTRA
jgi:anaerobic selenocysteine-containing dehydrogenase